MIPGPTELPFPVIQAMSQPPSIQYDRSFDEGVLEPTTLALRDVFQTKNEVIMMPGSGRTALETGALSVIEPGDRVLVVGAGQFGILMREIMNRTGADWTEFPVEWGARLDLARLQREAERTRPKAITLVHNETSTGTTYPAAEVGKIARSVGALFLLDTVSSIAGIDVRTDEWGVDLNMTGSQKCLAAPLGMALVAVSPRAWEVMEHRSKPARSWAYDLLRWKEWWIPMSRGGQVPDGAPRRQPVSMPTHLTAAMSVAVRLILEEGLAHRFRRHDFPSVFEGTPAHERLKKLGETRVYTARGADDEAELIRRIDGARAIVNIRAHARFTDAVFAACRNVKLVSIWGTGTDNVDLDAAGRRGVTVCNTPGVNAFAVAEHTLALMLAAARKIA